MTRHALPWRWTMVGLASLLALSGCGVLSPKTQPPCPPVLLLKDTDQLVRYRPGRGRDLTDVQFTAAIVDFLALCKYNSKRTSVDIELTVTFEAHRGPADTTHKAEFDYFVAIPQFYPAPQGKRVFHSSIAFKGNRARVQYRERVDLEIPLDPKKNRSVYTTYLGFQLTPEEIEANRRRKAR